MSFVDPLRLNIVTLGLLSTGKTCLLLSHAEGQCPGEYVPSIVDVFDMRSVVDGVHVLLQFYEVQGGDDYARLRPNIYALASVFICIFSVEYQASYEALENEFFTELQQHAPNIPIILVATKIDLRESAEVVERMRDKTGHGPFTYEDGVALAEKLHAVKYIEICSKRLQGVTETFEEAIRAVLVSRRAPKRKGGCAIM